MAVRRCPYCKAIIDEQDKYCNNCGTQLLFPEDEYIEEEIPGDKIVEEPEEKEQEAEELKEREEPEGAKPAEEEEEEEEKLEEYEEEEEGREGEYEEEEIEEERGERSEELEELVEEKEEEFEEEEEEIERPTTQIRTGEPAETQALIDELHKKYRVAIEEDELVFKTKELEGPTGVVEEVKERVAPTTREVLPPWAKGMKEKPPQSAEFGETKEPAPEGGVESGITPTRPEWATDSGIGMPEKITQAGLPFGTTSVPATLETREAVAEKGEEFGAAIRRQARFSLKLRSKLIDLVFITALWVISLWFTAQVIGVSFFRLIVGSPIPVLGFYFILLLLYFFLFLYFLGETLGDHYFSEED